MIHRMVALKAKMLAFQKKKSSIPVTAVIKLADLFLADKGFDMNDVEKEIYGKLLNDAEAIECPICKTPILPRRLYTGQQVWTCFEDGEDFGEEGNVLFRGNS